MPRPPRPSRTPRPSQTSHQPVAQPSQPSQPAEGTRPPRPSRPSRQSSRSSSAQVQYDEWGEIVETSPVINKKPLFLRRWFIALSSVLLVAALIASYFLLITPPVSSLPDSQKGSTSMQGYLSCLTTFQTDCIQGLVDPSFIPEELKFLNSNETRTKFVEAALGTVSMSLPEVQASNWFGKPAIDPFNRQPIMIPSTLNDGSEATFSFVDYSRIDINKEALASIATSQNLTINDVTFSEKATDLFAQYMTAYITKVQDLPMKEVSRVPSLACQGTYPDSDSSCRVSSDEDRFWDETLFGSEEFIALQNSFAEVLVDVLDPQHEVAKVQEAPAEDSKTNLPSEAPSKDSKPDAPTESLSPEEKEAASRVSGAAPEGSVAGSVVVSPTPSPSSPSTNPFEGTSQVNPFEGTSQVNPFEDITAEPSSPTVHRLYADKFYLEPAWLAGMSLSGLSSDTPSDPDDIDTSHMPRVGNGSPQAPAGIGTPVATIQYGEDGSKDPIEVTLLSFKTGEEAFTDMAARSPQNRGFDPSSDVKYALYKIRVKNLSDHTITIRLNDTLSDAQGNPTNRVGAVYGLKNAVELAPDESGVLESWTSSTNLDQSYLIWGANFSRSESPVFWRVLAGDR